MSSEENPSPGYVTNHSLLAHISLADGTQSHSPAERDDGTVAKNFRRLEIINLKSKELKMS